MCWLFFHVCTQFTAFNPILKGYFLWGEGGEGIRFPPLPFSKTVFESSHKIKGEGEKEAHNLLVNIMRSIYKKTTWWASMPPSPHTENELILLETFILDLRLKLWFIYDFRRSEKETKYMSDLNSMLRVTFWTVLSKELNK